MQMLNIEVECSKEIYELGSGVCKFVAKVKEALADGWKTGEDLPPILAAAMEDLVPAIQGVSSIKDEFAENKSAAINALVLPFSKLVGDLASK